jgi:hypothetical protein
MEAETTEQVRKPEAFQRKDPKVAEKRKETGTVVS